MKPTFFKSNLFKRSLLAAAIAGAGVSAYAGEAVFYVTEDGAAVQDIAVTVNGQKKLVGKNGFVTFDLGGGNHKVELSQFGEWAGEFDFNASKKQNAEIQVEMIGGEAIPEVSVYTPSQEQTAAVGKVSGYLESDETGGVVEGAVITIKGSELSVTTNSDGFYELEVPRGEYSLSISHPTYGNREVKNLRVIANVATSVNLNMSMSGDSMIEEVVAVGSYIPSTATAQQRDSSAVLNAIGSEQFSRFGDSNAASALKRVAGVTVSDGKYVVSRGLNERHSTIMLNGASLPSPDPSRRVVPLDIFPSTILDGIDVQKSFTPDVYADSTGAAIKLKTKKFPEEFEGKISASLGFVNGLTLNDREVQQTEGSDILGLGSEGDRALPASFETLEASGTNRSLATAEKFASNLGTEETTILPNTSLEISMGNTLLDYGNIQFGYTSSVKYSNSWSKRDGESNTYEVNNGVLDTDDRFKQKRTSNDINLGTGISFGLIAGNSEFSSNTMLLRQTHAENTIESGVGGDQNRQSTSYSLGWDERQFLFQQFTGEHLLEDAMETEINWQVSVSQASLNSPDRREYSFERDADEDDEVLELYWSSLSRTYNELTDGNTNASIDLSSLAFANDSFQAKLNYGYSTFSRSREADATTVKYYANGETSAGGFNGSLDVDEIVDSRTENGIVGVETGSRASDDYLATWDLTSYYLMTNIEMFDRFKVLLGARAEDSAMKLETFADKEGSITETTEVNDDDIFTSVSVLYYLSEEMQARLSGYETINRPDFREISNAFYVDPENYDRFVGNSDLESSKVSNVDLRLEYYFTDNETISLAYFTKDFDSPIEKTLKVGGEVRSYENGESGDISGFELDFRKEMDWDRFSGFVSGNFAQIDSEVDLVVGSTLKTQAMQGQPDQLANLQFGLDDLELGAEYTFLVNYQGESLDAVSIGDLPNIFKQPRTQLDFNFSKELSEDIKLKAKLKNITDAEYELTQGDQTYRKYKKGTEISIGLSMPL